MSLQEIYNEKRPFIQLGKGKRSFVTAENRMLSSKNFTRIDPRSHPNSFAPHQNLSPVLVQVLRTTPFLVL
ncbi:MAG: hypothetical protein RRX94_02015 [Raoultibacter sp.]